MECFNYMKSLVSLFFQYPEKLVAFCYVKMFVLTIFVHVIFFEDMVLLPTALTALGKNRYTNNLRS